MTSDSINVNVLKEVLPGLLRTPKSIPAKFLYDKKGSEIFERICTLDEYYPNRAEKEILADNATEIASLIGPRAVIIEPGSGAGEKIRLILPHLQSPSAYIPIEISEDILNRMTGELQSSSPKLEIVPLNTDFTEEFKLPSIAQSKKGKRIVFFPGSTIGNFDPNEGLQFLRRMGRIVGRGGGVLVGVDLKKDEEIFTRAYNDKEGVTAAFNLNILERMNRELETNFNIVNFTHYAAYNSQLSRIEMHLKSLIDQQVILNNRILKFAKGETIHTENSYKYSVEEFSQLCARARLELKRYWKDKSNLFCVYYFEKH